MSSSLDHNALPNHRQAVAARVVLLIQGLVVLGLWMVGQAILLRPALSTLPFRLLLSMVLVCQDTLRTRCQPLDPCILRGVRVAFLWSVMVACKDLRLLIS